MYLCFEYIFIVLARQPVHLNIVILCVYVHKRRICEFTAVKYWIGEYFEVYHRLG